MEYFRLEMNIKVLNKLGFWFLFFLTKKLLRASFIEILVVLGTFSTLTYYASEDIFRGYFGD